MNSGLDGRRTDAGRTGAGGGQRQSLSAAGILRQRARAMKGHSQGPESGGRTEEEGKKESVEARGKKDDVFLGRNFSVSSSF